MIAGWAINVLLLGLFLVFAFAGWVWLKGSALEEDQPPPESHHEPTTVTVLKPPYDQEDEEDPRDG